jgi:cell division protein ZapE
MSKYILQDSFLEFCKNNKFEINSQQIDIINSLDSFINPQKKLLNSLFRSKEKICFYLYGNVGVGKTMILNFVYNELKIKKLRLHFNEFMINFHNFKHKKVDNNIIQNFVKNLKNNYDLIYLDEFQVTNIVDAMILGKLFEIILSEKIKIIITTNTKLNDLYKDGLQREQFLPFISIIKKYSIEKELLLDDDYRLQDNENFERIFFPLNEKTSFKISQKFRELTRNKKKVKKIIATKGRNFKIDNFFEGVAKFKFAELCDVNIGAEDYINIAYVCDHIFIEDIPNFNEDNSNQQLRFITLIDILYEKEISLTLSLPVELIKLSSSKKHLEIFKRTLSRLFEMTKIK